MIVVDVSARATTSTTIMGSELGGPSGHQPAGAGLAGLPTSELGHHVPVSEEARPQPRAPIAAHPVNARRLPVMTADAVDAYLAGLGEPERSTLQALRRSIRAVVPDAEEGISYGMPAFRVDGKVVAGFAAFKNHLAYLPHSGEVLRGLGDRLAGYQCTKGSLHFPAGQPLPDDLVRSLVQAKLEILRR
jgi:uncharacterized protein YdhG (YjbR/CyaY superfamily)